MNKIESKRLILREWLIDDLKPFAALNQDIRVMEYYPSLLSESETADFIQRITHQIQKYGYGLFACTLKENNAFIGYVGLNIPSIEAHFTPCVEIGWRLAFEYWGHGYATEAAKLILAKGFNEWGLPEIVSYTTVENFRSRRVMERLGMTHKSEDDFRHPNLPLDHPLSLHVLYRITKKRYEEILTHRA